MSDFYFLCRVISALFLHFTKKCMESWASKLLEQAVVAQLFFRVIKLSYSVLQDITTVMVPTWPHNNRTNLYNFQFVLIRANVGVRISA